jgi:hypothetical protein
MMNKPRNPIAKDLRTPKYRMRVVSLEKAYNRKKEQQKLIKEIKHAVQE